MVTKKKATTRKTKPKGPKPGWHRHRCPECGFLWEHSKKNKNNAEAHTCPCGREVWYTFDEEGTPDFIGCGAPVLKGKPKQPNPVLSASDVMADLFGY